MINLQQLYDNAVSEFGTSQYGHFRPTADFVPAVLSISLDIFNKLAGMDGRSQKIEDWLTPFLVTKNVIVKKKPSYDWFPKPPDYEYWNGASVLVEDKQIGKVGLPGVEWLTDIDVCKLSSDMQEDFYPESETSYTRRTVRKYPRSKWSSVLSHPSKKPSIKSPASTPSGEEPGFELGPRNLGVVVLDYYRKPKQPVFNFDILVDGPDEYLQFKDSGSQHLEWSETLTPVFLYRLGKRYGVQVRDQLLLQVRQLDKLFE